MGKIKVTEEFKQGMKYAAYVAEASHGCSENGYEAALYASRDIIGEMEVLELGDTVSSDPGCAGFYPPPTTEEG